MHRPTTRSAVVAAIDAARTGERTTVIYLRVDAEKGVPGYDGWWDVPVAAVSEQPDVQQARKRWEQARARKLRL